MGKEQLLQYIVLGKVDSYMQENKTGLLSHTILKKNIMDYKFKCKSLNETIKLLDDT